VEKEFTEGDAFVAAYSEYFGVVYKEALKYSGNHHIAEEIAQDAFFTAYIQCGSESKQQIKTADKNMDAYVRKIQSDELYKRS